MRVTIRSHGAVLAYLAFTLGVGQLPASEFAERMAAWNAGPVRSANSRGEAAQVAYEEPAPAPAEISAESSSEPAAPATSAPPAGPRSRWQQEAFGHGAGSYGAPYDATWGGGMCGAGSGGGASCGRGFCGVGLLGFGILGCGPCGMNSCGMNSSGMNACGPRSAGGFSGYSNGEMCCGKPLWWAKADVLLWWRQGRDLPPIATTDSVDEDPTAAGILPEATILFGGGRESSQMAVGGRFDVGFWMDPNECWGIGNRFFGLGRDSARFHVDSLENPVLAVPFFNFDIDDNDALLIASPGLSTGSIDVNATSEVMGNDIYARFLVCRDCDSRLDFITGYHFSRINDDLRIRASSTVSEVGGNIPLGTVTSVVDRFDTRNEFHGAILGLMHEYDCCCWTVQTLGRISIGSMHERVIIDGSTRIAVPDEDPTVTAGGLFTGDENIGQFSRSEFTAITELGLTLGYKWGPCTRLSVGYSFIYWNDVLRPGDQIDPRVGESGTTGQTHPRFRVNHGDYWAQGLNLGLVREF